jgi:hypothetical protein
VAILEAKEADGTAFETRTNTFYNSLLVPVQEDIDNVHQALENYFQDEVDFTTPKGHSTKAEASTRSQHSVQANARRKKRGSKLCRRF